MRLYCVRHAEAENTPGLQGRCLSTKGVADVTQLAKFLQKYDIHVHELLHSDKLRAIETAKLLSQHITVDQMTERGALLGVNASVPAALEEIKLLTDNTMLVGHLPFIDQLVSALVVKDEDYYPIIKFRPATIVCLENFEHQRWIINWVLHPQLIIE